MTSRNGMKGPFSQMATSQPANESAGGTMVQPSRPLMVVTVGLIVFGAALLLPGATFLGLQKWVLLMVCAPLCGASFALPEAARSSTAFRGLVGLMFVMVYIHARSAMLPEAWVPKNEWDEAWRIPWTTLALGLVTPFWVAHWLGSRKRCAATPAQRAWTVAALFVVTTALVMFLVLSRAYSEAIAFSYTLSVSLQAVEAAMVFAMAAAPRSAMVQRLLLLAVLTATLLKVVMP